MLTHKFASMAKMVTFEGVSASVMIGESKTDDDDSNDSRGEFCGVKGNI